MTDGSQNAEQCYDYTPFGEEIDDNVGDRGSVGCYAGTLDERQKFTGKERDAESKLDYFLARYYSASLGRFTGPDAPLLDQSPANPQSWNLYGYVRNNPLVFIDPNGQRCQNGISVDTGAEGQDGNACFETTVKDDVAISNIYFNAAAEGINRAAPFVEGLAETLIIAAEFATPVPIGLIADVEVGEGSHAAAFLGGRYRDLPTGEGMERHHAPANSTNPLPKRDGPAVQMETPDHYNTSSHPRQGRAAQRYRQEIRELMDSGRTGARNALAREVRDVRRVARESGNARKYNSGLIKMIRYAKTIKTLFGK